MTVEIKHFTKSVDKELTTQPCILCGGETEIIQQCYSLEDEDVVVTNTEATPTFHCKDCGETTYNSEVEHELDKVAVEFLKDESKIKGPMENAISTIQKVLAKTG